MQINELKVYPTLERVKIDVLLIHHWLYKVIFRSWNNDFVYTVSLLQIDIEAFFYQMCWFMYVR